MARASHALLAGAVVVAPNGQILLVWRSARDSLFPARWALPAGFLRSGEHPDSAMVREVAEETGVRVKSGQLIGFSTFRAGRSECLQLNYLVRQRTRARLSHHLTERVTWADPSDALKRADPFNQAIIRRALEVMDG